MALENIFFTVRAGFNASIECLISDTTSSPTWLGSNVIPTPTGAANPVSVGPDVTGAAEVLSNSIPLPEGWNIEDIDVFQLFNCLPDADGASTHTSSFSNPAVLPLDNLRVRINFTVRTEISVDSYPYKVDPAIVEITPRVRTIPFAPKAWIDPGLGSFAVTSPGVFTRYIYTRVLNAGTAITLTGNDVTLTTTPIRLTAFTGQFYMAEPGVLYKPMVHVSATSLTTYDNEYQTVNGVTDGTYWSFYNAYSSFYLPYTNWRAQRHDPNSGRYFQAAGTFNTTSRWPDQRLYRKPGTDYGYECAIKTYLSSSDDDDQILWAYRADGSNPSMLSEPDLFFESTNNFIDHVVIRNNYVCVGYSGYDFGVPSPIVTEWRHPKKLESNTWYWITFEVYQGRGNIAIDGEFSPIDFKGITNDFQWWRFGAGNDTVTNGFDGYSFDWVWYFGNKRRGKNFTAPQPWLDSTTNDTSRPNWAEAIQYRADGLPEPVVFSYIPAP